MKERFELDPHHTVIGFTAKHLGVTTVRGSFTGYRGSFEADRADLKDAVGELTVEVSSVSTGSAQRDGHLVSADFFDAEKFPVMTWRLTGVESEGGDDFLVHGDLTIKETTRPITLKARLDGELDSPFKAGSKIVAVTAAGELNRIDYGLNWDGLAGAIPFAGHNIKLSIDAELIATPVEAEVASEA